MIYDKYLRGYKQLKLYKFDISVVKRDNYAVELGYVMQLNVDYQSAKAY